MNVTLVYKQEFSMNESIDHLLEGEDRQLADMTDEEIEAMAIEQMDGYDFNEGHHQHMEVIIDRRGSNE